MRAAGLNRSRRAWRMKNDGDRALLSMVREVLWRGESLSLIARGQSMSPQIRDGDRVWIKAVNRLKIGDLAAVCIGDQLVIHRVIWPICWQPGQRFLLKGDHRRFCDGWFGATQFLGRIERIERRGRPVHFYWSGLLLSLVRSLAMHLKEAQNRASDA